MWVKSQKEGSKFYKMSINEFEMKNNSKNNIKFLKYSKEENLYNKKNKFKEDIVS